MRVHIKLRFLGIIPPQCNLEGKTQKIKWPVRKTGIKNNSPRHNQMLSIVIDSSMHACVRAYEPEHKQQPTTVMRMSNQTDRVIFPNSIFRQKHNTSCWYQFLDFTYDSNRELQSRALICICLKSTKSTDVTMRVFFVVKMTENSSIIKCSRQFSKVPCMRACVWARTQIVDACSHTSNQQPTTVMRMSNHTDRVIFPNSVFSTKTQYIVLISVFGFHIWSKSGATKSCPDLHMFEINKSADVTMRVFFVVKMTENSSIINYSIQIQAWPTCVRNTLKILLAKTQIANARIS
jgi:hypothetical protein